MQPGISEAQSVAAKRGARRIPSSTAKLDILIAHNERLEGSINRLADSVHQLAMSSVRFEEKSSTQEARITELEKDTSELKVTVSRLEENRLSQQYWMRTIGGTILVPMVVGVVIVAGWVYLQFGAV